MSVKSFVTPAPAETDGFSSFRELVYLLNPQSNTRCWSGPKSRIRSDDCHARVGCEPIMDDWSELLAQSQDGDKAAYRRFLSAIVPFLRVLAYRQLGASSAVEDVVQETLISIHRARHTYDPARPVRPWLAAIAHRRCQDHFRALARQQRARSALAEQPAAQAGPPALDVRQLQAAIERLPPTQRLAIRRLKIEGMSLSDLSAATGAARWPPSPPPR